MFIGFDTSNYTTSVAFFDGKEIVQQKQLLKVKNGARGLRQSEAVFQHTVNLPDLLQKMPAAQSIDGIGVSTRPRNIPGSYMPCFLVGKSAAAAAAKAAGCPLVETSHQVGHILSALYSAACMDWIHRPFIAFHVSGGTTETLLVKPNAQTVLEAETIAQSTDLKAGQLVDRTGILLGLDFPCGSALEQLAATSRRSFQIRPSMKGTDCSLSGVENKVKAMYEAGESKADIALYVLQYIAQTLKLMTAGLFQKYGQLPLLFAGGVMSDAILREEILKEYDAHFASPAFSCDNAAGIALYAALKTGK